MKNLILLSILLYSAVSIACDKSQICVSDRVVDTQNDTGRVLAIFSNGKVRVDWDKPMYGVTITSLGQLSKSIKCIEGFCIGRRILDQDHDTGRILEAFSNGKVRVDWDKPMYGVTVYSIKNLSLQDEICGFAGFCVGDRIVDEDNDTGRIIATYANGMVRVDWDKTSYGLTHINSKKLGKSYRCSGKLCVGEYIIDNDNDTGRVIEIFDNGKVKVDWDRPSYGVTVTSINNLGYLLADCYN